MKVAKGKHLVGHWLFLGLLISPRLGKTAPKEPRRPCFSSPLYTFHLPSFPLGRSPWATPYEAWRRKGLGTKVVGRSLFPSRFASPGPLRPHPEARSREAFGERWRWLLSSSPLPIPSLHSGRGGKRGERNIRPGGLSLSEVRQRLGVKKRNGRGGSGKTRENRKGSRPIAHGQTPSSKRSTFVFFGVDSHSLPSPSLVSPLHPQPLTHSHGRAKRRNQGEGGKETCDRRKEKP